MSTRTKWITISALLCGVAFSQSPPFPSGLSFSSSSRFVKSDYIIEDTGQIPNIAWQPEGANGEDQGLRVRVQTPGNPPTSLQHRRSFKPGTGITARAKMRVRMDHVDDGEAKFGFFSEQSDPFEATGSEPKFGAYFYQKQGWTDENDCEFAEIWARVNNDTAASTESKLFEYQEDFGAFCKAPDGDVYDLIVEVNGTSNVTFYWKPAGESSFDDSHEFTTDLPTGEMHFSAANRCIQGANGYTLFRKFGWEVVED